MVIILISNVEHVDNDKCSYDGYDGDDGIAFS